MGVGTNIIGYSDETINRNNKKIIEYNNVSTLNSEYDLKLSKINFFHPWASKALFAGAGAEANAIALRLARAYSKKMKLPFVDIMAGMIGIYLQFK